MKTCFYTKCKNVKNGKTKKTTEKTNAMFSVWIISISGPGKFISLKQNVQTYENVFKNKIWKMTKNEKNLKFCNNSES